jgi:hypothetical protein
MAYFDTFAQEVAKPFLFIAWLGFAGGSRVKP